MPTGYTAPIEEGEITFETFVLRCARAFEACVTMREESIDALPPEKIEPSDWNLKRLREAEAKVKELDGMTEAQAEKLAAVEWERAETQRNKSLDRCVEVVKRYKTMLERVQAWKPPTPDHAELKAFMIQQIEVSTEHNMLDYYQKETPRLSGRAYLEAERVKAGKDIAYHRDEWAKEQTKAVSRTKWLRQLRGSLSQAREGKS